MRAMGNAQYQVSNSILTWRSIGSSGMKEQGETQRSRSSHGARGGRTGRKEGFFVFYLSGPGDEAKTNVRTLGAKLQTKNSFGAERARLPALR